MAIKRGSDTVQGVGKTQTPRARQRSLRVTLPDSALGAPAGPSRQPAAPSTGTGPAGTRMLTGKRQLHRRHRHGPFGSQGEGCPFSGFQNYILTADRNEGVAPLTSIKTRCKFFSHNSTHVPPCVNVTSPKDLASTLTQLLDDDS